MLLKNYQRRALEKLERFFDQARAFGNAKAFAKIAPLDENRYARDYTPLPGVKGPHVCLRLPTGGGKTLLAAHSIAKSAHYLEKKFPVALWMTPSKTIRKQTVEALKNQRHPYRKAMNRDFNGRVKVWDISECFNIRPQDMTDAACVVVATIQALRVNDTEGRKVYAHNENFEAHFNLFPHAGLDLEKDGDGRVKFSFANLLHIHRPAVIVDEAHNAVTGLSKELHRRLQPACIIEFTATPRDSKGKLLHNVLVSVPATDLRDEEMIKLPVVLAEHGTWQEAVAGAVGNRRRLAEIAKKAGEKIRPVVLYQAQAKNQEVTVEKLEAHLVEREGIPGEKIAVATGERRELDDVDIGDPQCPVEHVITVQALKEGWDCPFAYVLCSVANVRSATGVEQLLGRVMRMPYATRCASKELNRAYAHVPETDFAQAAGVLRDKLVQKMGFEEEEIPETLQHVLPEWAISGAASGEPQPLEILVDAEPDFSQCSQDEREISRQTVDVSPQKDGKVRVVVKGATPKPVRDAIVGAVNNPHEKKKVDCRLRAKNDEFQMAVSPSRRKVEFAPLPQLFLVLDGGDLEVSAEEIELTMRWNPLEQDNCILTEDEFHLSQTPHGFELTLDSERATITIQDAGKTSQHALRVPPGQWTEMTLTRELHKEVRTMYLPSQHMEEFILCNVQALLNRGHKVEFLAGLRYQLARILNDKLAKLRNEKKERHYQEVLFGGGCKVLCKHTFKFPPDVGSYAPNFLYQGPYAFKNHYYGPPGDLKSTGEEHECAIALDSIPQIKHWVRNVPNKANSFRLPHAFGWFYPDFVAELHDGRCLAVEYKGEMLKTNIKTARLQAIGKLWADKSGGKALFLMPTKGKNQPSVREQIEAKIRAQSGDDGGR